VNGQLVGQTEPTIEQFFEVDLLTLLITQLHQPRDALAGVGVDQLEG
jgi:hypothetical protein